ncbi:SigE family RNA polymerase sigma factor [Kineosporia mesophila]|uniref:SigE family RNA polymerase sigma factor n=1 Tax=Kineosporia mesophila TaxID=566012 RepID=UPI001E2EA44F|nr:SigE family RNA polymerase sigma factor [Kineosporia mesophila]
MGTSDAEFEAFVAAHGPGLLAFARALTANRSDAEDLMQSALTSAYARWPSIRVDEALAYVRRSIANGRVSLWRRRSSREVLGFEMDVVSYEHHDEDTVERLALRAALLRLPRGQRVVLVLRYLLDQSDAQIAEILGISLAGVRSQAHRGLKTLREQVESPGRQDKDEPTPVRRLS